MKLFRQASPLPAEFLRGAVAVGNFDGVHRGHAKLIERLLARAREVGGPAVVLTFDPHPVRILRPELAPPPLTWTERKAELLSELGVTAVWSYPTDEALLKLTAEEFFQRIVGDALQARAMVEGPNFQFGRQRQGNVDLLQKLCQASGLALEVVQPIATDGEMVSSSRVRESIQQGDVATARQMLTRAYRLRGLVTHGAQRGAKIGFPTANLAGIDTLVPPVGVYAGRAFTQQGIWPAAINIGPNPTFGEGAFKFEAHLPGFSGSLYSQPLEVEFLARVRDTRPFESVAALTQQLAADVQTVIEVVRQDDSEEAQRFLLSEVENASKFPNAGYFGFSDFHSFKDYVGFVCDCAPDFPAEDWLEPAEQLNLARALVGLEIGYEIIEKEGVDCAIVERCRRITSEAQDLIKLGKEEDGIRRLSEVDRILAKLPSS